MGRPRVTKWWRATALAVLTGVLSTGPAATHSSADAGPAASSAGRDFFTYPAAATVRDLGDIASAPCPSDASQVCQGTTPSPYEPVLGNYPLDVTGLGVPLGGVGAGSFMVNQSGTFGPWFFGGSQDDSWEMRALPQAAFHVREQVGGAPATTRTLATKGPQVTGTTGPVADRSWESPLPTWNLLRKGEGSYAALYPFGWTNYTPFKTDVSMRFFSPIVAGEDRRTSLPVAYFDVRLANHTTSTTDVSVMFTMPNVAAHEDRKPATVRTGLKSRFHTDARTGVQAVTMSADDPGNTADAAESEWTIAARPRSGQKVTYTTSWNADGDGSDVYAPFEKTGRLTDAPLDSSASAGAVSVSMKLKPGQVSTVPFALTWDFPQVSFADDNTVWMRRYTDFYGAKETSHNDYVKGSYPFHQSFAIADDALAGHDRALRDVLRWWEPIATNPAYPVALRTGALNQLAQVPFKTALWEGGLVSNSVTPTGGKRLGTSVPGTHLYLGVDSPAGGEANGGMGTEVGTFSYLAYSQVFPTIERDRLRAKVEAVLADPTGDPYDPSVTSSTDPSVYTANGDPFVTRIQGPQQAPGTVWFIDRPSENAFRLYDYARSHHDRKFLATAYPAMKKLLAYVQATIPAKSELPEAPSLLNPDPDLKSPLPYANVFDIIPVNKVDAYTSQLYLLALEAVIDAGRQLGEVPTRLTAWQARLDRAKAEYESVFWDAAHHYYRYTPGPTATQDSVLLATFFAQHLAERAGLPDLVDPAHYQRQLACTYSLFVSRTDAQGRLLGAPNMALPADVPSFPYVHPYLGTRFETEVWPSANYATAAAYYAAGRRFGDAALQQDGLEMAGAVATQIWQVPENGFQFDAPIGWNQARTDHYTYPAFESGLAAWEVLDAIQPVKIPS
ncbi:GH116 family glycosyl-hydrolase [Streptomyces sp. NPDC090499]|uniref:GH116 family glycosyl-hydrolase n=1 Tax=Streptomyces sp. NPDC090499 TaxID=3365965 RepID=UPI00381F23CD